MHQNKSDAVTRILITLIGSNLYVKPVIVDFFSLKKLIDCFTIFALHSAHWNVFVFIFDFIFIFTHIIYTCYNWLNEIRWGFGIFIILFHFIDRKSIVGSLLWTLISPSHEVAQNGNDDYSIKKWSSLASINIHWYFPSIEIRP